MHGNRPTDDQSLACTATGRSRRALLSLQHAGCGDSGDAHAFADHDDHVFRFSSNRLNFKTAEAKVGTASSLTALRTLSRVPKTSRLLACKSAIHLYGAMIVKLDLGSFPHLLVRPVGDHLLVPIWLRAGRRAQ
jgi:hypothetical protein